MTIEWGPEFKRDYRALNAATKMRVEVALRRLVAGDSRLETVIVDPRDFTEAAIVDEFLCMTFQRNAEGFLLLGIHSIEHAGR